MIVNKDVRGIDRDIMEGIVRQCQKEGHRFLGHDFSPPEDYEDGIVNIWTRCLDEVEERILKVVVFEDQEAWRKLSRFYFSKPTRGMVPFGHIYSLEPQVFHLRNGYVIMAQESSRNV